MDTTNHDVHLLNSLVKHLKDKKELKLQFNFLEKEYLKLYVFVDIGYNTNPDGTSQLGVTVCLVDKQEI